VKSNGLACTNAASNIDRPDGINGCQSKPLLWFNSLLIYHQQHRLQKKPPMVLFFMHLWCHTSTMMMMTSKNMKKWPTAAGYKKSQNSSFHIIQHWPSKRCSINDCCLWIKKSKRNHAKIHQEFKKEQSKTSIAAAKKIPSINEQPLST